MKTKTKTEKYKKIYELKKQSIENNELCGNLFGEFNVMLNYIINLEFTEKPDYSKILKLIDILMEKYNYSYDLQFDWYNLAFLKNLYKNSESNIENKKSSGNNEIVEINENKNKNEKGSNDSLNMKNIDEDNKFEKRKYKHPIKKLSASNTNMEQYKKNKDTTYGHFAADKNKPQNANSLIKPKVKNNGKILKTNFKNMKNSNKNQPKEPCHRISAVIKKTPNNI